MGIFNLFQKPKQTEQVQEHEQDQEQLPTYVYQDQEQTTNVYQVPEQVMTFVYHESMLPKQKLEKWQEGLPDDYKIRTVVLTEWNKSDGDIIKKGEKLFDFQIQQKLTSTIYGSVDSEFDGLLEILKKPSNYLLASTDPNNIMKEGESIFKSYREPYEEKLLEIKNKRFRNTPLIKKDIFSGLTEIKWESVAIGLWEGYYKGIYDSIFFVDENKEKRIFFTLNNIGNKDFIVFRYPTKDYKLTVGSKISFLFSNDEIHQFEIINKPYKHSEDYSWGHIFETSVQLTIEELKCLQENELKGWQIELIENGNKITGITDSPDIQFSVKKFAKEYCEIVQREVPNYIPLVSRPATSNASTLFGDECYIYLMIDLTNNYHKIGISNNPGFREKTLQSEKPTIEMICNKRFPNRKIANSFEQALHNTYRDKRVRGEWFNLSDKDIQELKECLQ